MLFEKRVTHATLLVSCWDIWRAGTCAIAGVASRHARSSTGMVVAIVILCNTILIAFTMLRFP